MFRAISGHRVIDATFPRKRRAATRIYRYRRTPPVHLDVPPVCRHGIVRLIPWNRHVISWPGRLPAARRVAHANVPLMSLVLLRPPPRPFLLARPATSFQRAIVMRDMAGNVALYNHVRFYLNTVEVKIDTVSRIFFSLGVKKTREREREKERNIEIIV